MATTPPTGSDDTEARDASPGGTPGGRSPDLETETHDDVRAAQVADEPEAERVLAGMGPYRLALRRLRRNKVALAFGGLFLLIVILCLLAPVYSNDVAHISPNANDVTGTVNVGGKRKDIVSPQGVPIGPTYQGRFFFGADPNGRDVAVRLLYGGRNSLEIGIVATLITVIVATLIGVLSGYLRGFVDGALGRLMELIWAYPVLLLGIALGTALSLGGIGPISGNSLLIPAFIIGIAYIPYLGKPIRGQVLRLREQDFVDAARAQGAGPVRIMVSEILPNVATTIIVFFPLLLANAILLEAALSFLGAGVQPPNPSWGTLISDGIPLITVAGHLTLVPGVMLVLCVLGINVFGDGLRDALDPRSQVRIEH